MATPESVALPRILVRVTTEADWERVRDLRLEALADAPAAFDETLEMALELDDDQWRSRAARGAGGPAILVAAIDEDADAWVGSMGGFAPSGSGSGSGGSGVSNAAGAAGAAGASDTANDPVLVGVYVDPDYRGRQIGVADRLLIAVEAWARGHGDALVLHVHEDNQRAINFYSKRGYFATGHTIPYRHEPGGNELELRKVLREQD